MRNNKKVGGLIFTVLALLFVGVMLFNASTFSVQYGQVSILTRFGKIVGDPKDPGLHFKVPFIDEVVTYRTQKIVYETLSFTPYSGGSNSDYQDFAVDTNTKDGQQVSIRYTVRFSIDPEKIKDVANTLGTEEEVVEKIVKTDSRIWARQIARNYSAADLYTGNVDEVSEEIAEKLLPIFEDNGLILDEFGIRSLEFTEEYIQAVEQKQIEKEKVSTEEFIAQQEEFKKKAAITKAEGEAEAQRLQQASLNQALINKLWIEKWNGQLPDVVAGDSSGLILDLGDQAQQ